MSFTLSNRFAGSVLLLGALALVACAEGASQPTTSTSGGDGGANGNGGASGDGGAGDGGKSSSKSSSSSKASSSSSGGDGGSGEGGIGPSSCGNTVCDPGETCASCPNDCTENCQAQCGDGFCNGSETCSSCAADCNECTEDCGNGICDPQEQQTCPQDCQAQGVGSTFAGGGMCPPDACQAGGTADAMCLDPCVLLVCIADESCCAGEWTQSCADNASLAASIGLCAC